MNSMPIETISSILGSVKSILNDIDEYQYFKRALKSIRVFNCTKHFNLISGLSSEKKGYLEEVLKNKRLLIPMNDTVVRRIFKMKISTESSMQ